MSSVALRHASKSRHVTGTNEPADEQLSFGAFEAPAVPRPRQAASRAPVSRPAAQTAPAARLAFVPTPVGRATSDAPAPTARLAQAPTPAAPVREEHFETAPIPDPFAPRGTSAADASGVSFDDVLTGAWRQLRGHRAVTCPVCDARMSPGSGRDVAGGRCGGCGSTLA